MASIMSPPNLALHGEMTELERHDSGYTAFINPALLAAGFSTAATNHNEPAALYAQDNTQAPEVQHGTGTFNPHSSEQITSSRDSPESHQTGDSLSTDLSLPVVLETHPSALAFPPYLPEISPYDFLSPELPTSSVVAQQHANSVSPTQTALDLELQNFLATIGSTAHGDPSQSLLAYLQDATCNTGRTGAEQDQLTTIVEQIAQRVADRVATLQLSPQVDGERNALQALAYAPAHATDTEGSWNEDEHSGAAAEYYRQLEVAIDKAAEAADGHVVTAPLRSRARKAVHMMAHLRSLSHVTIGSGKERRVLISSDDIAPDSFEGKATKLWTRGCSSYQIVPTSIKIMNIPNNLTTDGLLRFFRVRNAPLPTSIQYFDNYGCITQHSPQYAVADFDEEEDVANFVMLLQAAKLTTTHTGLSIRYKRERRPPNGSLNTTAVDVNRNIRTGSIHIATPLLHRPPTPFRASLSTGLGSNYSSDGSASSGGGYYSSDMSYASSDNGNPNKRRRRQAAIENGYICSHLGCGKVFSRAGERTKHERIHLPASARTYHCTLCTLAFWERKDLARHVARQHESGDINQLEIFKGTSET